MINALLLMALLAALCLPSFAQAGKGIHPSPESVERGKALFTQYCSGCHGLKYYRGAGAGGFKPAIDAGTAEAAFGVVPQDLSLMAAARGRGDEGAGYIFRLLTTYYEADGEIRNRAFAEETATDGAIAMPSPIPMDDPGLREKSGDIAAFLLDVADPSRAQRLWLGPRVLAYMSVLTVVLYILNRLTWRGLKQRHRR